MDETSLLSLSEAERRTLQRYLDEKKPPLSASKSAQLFALFLQGYTVEEISRNNPGIEVGCILRARIDFNWDKHRERYLNDLYGNIKEKIAQVQAEAVNFAADAMSVYHKLQGNKFRAFLQSGNEETLGEWADFSFKTYKDYAEILLKLTGQTGKQQGLTIEVPQNSTIKPIDVESSVPTTTVQQFDAAKILDELVKDVK